MYLIFFVPAEIRFSVRGEAVRYFLSLVGDADFPQKRPDFTQKRPDFTQKRPDFTQKRPHSQPTIENKKGGGLRGQRAPRPPHGEKKNAARVVGDLNVN